MSETNAIDILYISVPQLVYRGTQRFRVNPLGFREEFKVKNW